MYILWFLSTAAVVGESPKFGIFMKHILTWFVHPGVEYGIVTPLQKANRIEELKVSHNY